MRSRRGSDYELLHGEAVAIGMLQEATLAEQLGVAESGTAAQLMDAIDIAGFDGVATPDAERIMSMLHIDKKSRAGTVEFALPKRIGMMARHGKEWTIPVSDDAIRELFPNG